MSYGKLVQWFSVNLIIKNSDNNNKLIVEKQVFFGTKIKVLLIKINWQDFGLSLCECLHA